MPWRRLCSPMSPSTYPMPSRPCDLSGSTMLLCQSPLCERAWEVAACHRGCTAAAESPPRQDVPAAIQQELLLNQLLSPEPLRSPAVICVLQLIQASQGAHIKISV